MKKIIGFLIFVIILLNAASLQAQNTPSQISDEQAHEIVLNGTPDDVKKLIQSGYDVNKVYNCNTLLNTAIKSAARGEDSDENPSYAVDKVKILVNAGADVNLIPCDGFSMTALNWAVSLPMHTYSLEQEIYSKLNTLPQKEGECNFPGIVSKPCKSISQEDLKKIKETIHSSFVIKNKYLVPYFMEIIRCLVEHGANVNSNSENGMKTAPIHLAAMNNEEITLEPLEYLIRNGANVNVLDAMGNTPLFYAFGRGNTKAIKLLKDSGANIKIRNIEGVLYDEVTVQYMTTYFSENLFN